MVQAQTNARLSRQPTASYLVATSQYRSLYANGNGPSVVGRAAGEDLRNYYDDKARGSSRQGARDRPQGHQLSHQDRSSSTSALLSKSLIVDKCWGDYCAPPLVDVGRAQNGFETKDAAGGHR